MAACCTLSAYRSELGPSGGRRPLDPRLWLLEGVVLVRCSVFGVHVGELE